MEAHETARPFLLRLLIKGGAAYREVALSVIAASLDHVPISDVYGRALLRPLLQMLDADADEMKEESLEHLLACLTACIALLPPTDDAIDTPRLLQRCVLMAGSKMVLVRLWRTPDTVHAQFMEALCSLLLTGKEAKVRVRLCVR